VYDGTYDTNMGFDAYDKTNKTILITGYGNLIDTLQDAIYPDFVPYSGHDYNDFMEWLCDTIDGYDGYHYAFSYDDTVIACDHENGEFPTIYPTDDYSRRKEWAIYNDCYIVCVKCLYNQYEPYIDFLTDNPHEYYIFDDTSYLELMGFEHVENLDIAPYNTNNDCKHLFNTLKQQAPEYEYIFVENPRAYTWAYGVDVYRRLIEN
jgi:hypothetical protein